MNIKKDYRNCIQKKNFNQDVIILGSLNMDLNLETNRLPNIGETFEGSSFYVTPGGKGGNQLDEALYRWYLEANMEDDKIGNATISKKAHF